MSLFRRLILGCWRRHVQIRERDATGTYQLVCEICGDRQAMLPGQVLRVKKLKKVKRPRLTLAKFSDRKRA